MHLLYTRFRSVTSQLSPLLSELERRAEAHPEDLSALLSECHSAYFAARKGLLVGRLMEEIRGLDPAHTELVELVSYAWLRLAICSFKTDECRLQLSETALHRRVQSLPRVFQFWRGPPLVSNIFVSILLLIRRHQALILRTYATTFTMTCAPGYCMRLASQLSAKYARCFKP